MASALLREDQVLMDILHDEIRVATQERDQYALLSNQTDAKDPNHKLFADQFKAFKTKVENLNRDLRAHIHDANKRYSEWQKHMAAGSSQQTTIPITNPKPEKDIKGLKLPEPFDGNPRNYSTWIFQCQNILRVQPSYDKDEKKIVFLGTLMVKSACAWYEQWVKSHSRASGQITSTYAEFVKDLESTFKDKLEVTTCHKVFSSRQGTRSISDYAIEFRTLCSKAELEVDHQIDIFMKSLNSGIKAIWHPQTLRPKCNFQNI
ncbi:hypothetical protein SeLEV6574_g02033 [Synchytrium endobioticum]|uniref:Retrotransposon gag domain-containing protein n=1 Tax=Synchytrium endobioticum TaxID=286115 RepID=A0A507DAM0_9FUNG|nr:hypothetical protein SeLEV6574_g02033 [Synchytrium endobioticum]